MCKGAATPSLSLSRSPSNPPDGYSQLIEKMIKKLKGRSKPLSLPKLARSVHFPAASKSQCIFWSIASLNWKTTRKLWLREGWKWCMCMACPVYIWGCVVWYHREKGWLEISMWQCFDRWPWCVDWSLIWSGRMVIHLNSSELYHYTQIWAF